jgi:hypothetical protein
LVEVEGDEVEMWRGLACRGSVLIGAAAVVVVAGATVPAARAGIAEQAARAMRLDPAARVGGNTQVATAPGARLLGVPLRANFMLAFGARERIRGGVGHDELGSRGRDNRVLGGPGNDLLHGGGGDVLDGGGGNDLIVDTEGGATVRTGPGRDKVIAPGRGDLVVCSAGSHDNLIYADRSDTIAPSCHRNRSRVLYRPAPTVAPRPAHIAQQSIDGDGSNANPYTARCDNPDDDPCTTTFPARTLGGFWSNEYVPAYKCQFEREFLLDQNFVPFGTDVPDGVEVQGLGPVGVSISFASAQAINYQGQEYTLFTGTLTGGENSSATNWDGYGSSYRIILHCTNDPTKAASTTG